MLQSHVHAFLVVALAGVAAGLLFDLLRVLRWRLKPGLAVSAAADLFYWGLVTLVLGAALFTGNWGELRLYVLLALGTGAALYYYLASPAALWFFQLLTGLIAAVWRTAIGLAQRLLIAPLVALGAMVWRISRVAGLTAGRPLIRAGRWGKRRWLGWQQRVVNRVLAWLFPPEDDPPEGGEPPRA